MKIKKEIIKLTIVFSLVLVFIAICYPNNIDHVLLLSIITYSIVIPCWLFINNIAEKKFNHYYYKNYSILARIKFSIKLTIFMACMFVLGYMGILSHEYVVKTFHINKPLCSVIIFIAFVFISSSSYLLAKPLLEPKNKNKANHI